MTIPPVTAGSLGPLEAQRTVTGVGKIASGAAADGEFSGTIRDLLAEANKPHLQADEALRQLASGETDNVHEVVMSMVRADMSFRFVLELRNRLTDAYQELMRMQV